LFLRRLLPKTMERTGGAPPAEAAPPIPWPDLSTKPKHKNPEQLANKDGNLFVIRDALTSSECRSLIEAVEASGGFEWQGSRGPSKGEAVRDCGRVSRKGRAEEALVAKLWKRLAPAILTALPPRDAERACGLNPYVRVYSYAPGQRFSRHYDDTEEVERGRRHTGFTLLIYLSGGGGSSSKKEEGGGGSCSPCFRGGETNFYSDGGKLVASVAPVTGMALLHRHGDRCMLHEGAKVEKGAGGRGGGKVENYDDVKYLFRSDVVFECEWWS